jgi:hypothetical protein
MLAALKGGFRSRSWDDDSRSVDGIILYGGKRLIRLLQRKYGYLWLQPDVSGDFEKIAGIGSSHVGNAAYLALAPQETVIVEFRNPVEMDGVDGNDASFSQARERGDDDFSAGRESHGTVKLHGWPFGFTAHPLRAQRFRQLAMRRAAGRDIYVAVPRAQNCDPQMGGCTKAEQPNAVSRFHPSHSQTAKANNAGAQQRRGVQIIQFEREGIDKIAARGRVFCITAIDGISGEDWRVAKILESAAAIGTIAIDTAHPGNTDARSERQLSGRSVHNITHDLVAWNELPLARRQLAFSDVQVGAADSAGSNPKKKLTGCKLRLGSLFDTKRLFRRTENGGFQEYGPKDVMPFQIAAMRGSILAGIPDVPCSRVTRAAVARNVLFSALA